MCHPHMCPVDCQAIKPRPVDVKIGCSLIWPMPRYRIRGTNGLTSPGACGLVGPRDRSEGNVMTFESWAAFTAASAVLLIIPGPTVLLVVSYALGQGWRTVLPMTVGVALGDFTAMTLSMLGLGALLAAS